MVKYYDDKYDSVRKEIREFIDIHGSDYEIIKYAALGSEKAFDDYLNMANISKKWNINHNDWDNLVKLEIDGYKNTLPTSVKGVIFSDGYTNDFEVPSSRNSTWYSFKKEILVERLKFDHTTIENIEKDTLDILNNLKYETKVNTPVKGLVIGGVQSGKTTNMAALMAMASDNGFNIFVILSGLNENLRVQTESRIHDFMYKRGFNRDWQLISRPEFGNGYELSKMFKNGASLYTVVLKNKSRLEKLITWLNEDPNIMKDLRILVIDDEADQASINTSKVNSDVERKAINRLIVNLTQSRTYKGKRITGNYQAMNYIGYTATPYANLLNETPGDESLYPQNFISMLSVSDSHFGPKEIFGLLGNDEEDNGIDIVLEIKKDKSFRYKKFLDGTGEIPLELKESISYFIFAAASLRIHNFNKPVSMLIHLSHEKNKHDNIFNGVDKWLKSGLEEIIELGSVIWEKERSKDLFSEMKGKVKFNIETSLIPHSKELIINEVKEILKIVSPLIQDEDRPNVIKYHKGIHTIVDNSSDWNSDEFDYRLKYPSSVDKNNPTPIFIVIGGTTLSRGLTLEGLITSFFLRTPGSADTLAQMGRWFGYRINYELYPRIWLTNDTKEQFKYLATMDYELREEISTQNKLGTDFSTIGPKIKYSPQYVNITAKNKSQSSRVAEYDFTGFNTQTYIFDENKEIQLKNIEVAENFINSLGKPLINNHNKVDGVFWKNIEFSKINNELLKDFTFNNRIKAFNNIDNLIEWVNKMTLDGSLSSWNVILGGIGKVNDSKNEKTWNLEHVIYNKINRSRDLGKKVYDGEINIGSLRSPSDLYMDLSSKQLERDDIAPYYKSLDSSSTKYNYHMIRKTLGLERNPQLFIYRIDQNSIPQNERREALNIDYDLIGIYIVIPNGVENKSFSTYVQIGIKEELEYEIDEGENI